MAFRNVGEYHDHIVKIVALSGLAARTLNAIKLIATNRYEGAIRCNRLEFPDGAYLRVAEDIKIEG